MHECRIPGFNLRYAIICVDICRPDSVKSPPGYRTRHFFRIRPDSGPDLMSSTPLVCKEIDVVVVSGERGGDSGAPFGERGQ